MELPHDRRHRGSPPLIRLLFGALTGLALAPALALGQIETALSGASGNPSLSSGGGASTSGAGASAVGAVGEISAGTFSGAGGVSGAAGFAGTLSSPSSILPPVFSGPQVSSDTVTWLSTTTVMAAISISARITVQDSAVGIDTNTFSVRYSTNNSLTNFAVPSSSITIASTTATAPMTLTVLNLTLTAGTTYLNQISFGVSNLAGKPATSAFGVQTSGVVASSVTVGGQPEMQLASNNNPVTAAIVGSPSQDPIALQAGVVRISNYYDLQPSSTPFSPPIQVTFHFDPSKLGKTKPNQLSVQDYQITYSPNSFFNLCNSGNVSGYPNPPITVPNLGNPALAAPSLSVSGSTGTIGANCSFSSDTINDSYLTVNIAETYSQIALFEPSQTYPQFAGTQISSDTVHWVSTATVLGAISVSAQTTVQDPLHGMDSTSFSVQYTTNNALTWFTVPASSVTVASTTATGPMTLTVRNLTLASGTTYLNEISFSAANLQGNSASDVFAVQTSSVVGSTITVGGQPEMQIASNNNPVTAQVVNSPAADPIYLSNGVTRFSDYFDLQPSSTPFNPPLQVKFAFDPSKLGKTKPSGLGIYDYQITYSPQSLFNLCLAGNVAGYPNPPITVPNLGNPVLPLPSADPVRGSTGTISSNCAFSSDTVTDSYITANVAEVYSILALGAFTGSASSAPVTTLSLSGGQAFAAFGQTYITPDALVALTATSSYPAAVISTSYSIDGGILRSYTAPFSLAEGTHTVAYFSQDQAGNVETSHSRTFNVSVFESNVFSAGSRRTESLTGGSLAVGNVTVNGPLSLSGKASIQGNATASSIDVDGLSKITGSRIILADALNPSPFDLGAALSSATAYNRNADIAAYLDKDGVLNLNNKSLALKAGSYLVKGIDLDGRAVLTAQGPVAIFVQGSVNLNGGSRMNADSGADAANLVIFADMKQKLTDDKDKDHDKDKDPEGDDKPTIALTGNSSLGARLYAPNAQATISGNSTFGGHLFAASVKLSGHSILAAGHTVPTPPRTTDIILPADTTLQLGEVYAFPNPAKHGANPTIHVEAGLADSLELHIYDIAGNLIKSVAVTDPPQVIDDGSGRGPRYAYEYVWDVSGVGSGIYIYVATAHSGQSTVRATKKVAVIK